MKTKTTVMHESCDESLVLIGWSIFVCESNKKLTISEIEKTSNEDIVFMSPFNLSYYQIVLSGLVTGILYKQKTPRAPRY